MPADDAGRPSGDSPAADPAPAQPEAADPSTVDPGVPDQVAVAHSAGPFSGSDTPTPPGGFPGPWGAGVAQQPRVRKSRRKLWLSLGAAAAAVVLLVVGYTGVRFLVDLGSYHDGHEAYQRADCAAAVGEFDSVIGGWRVVTLGGTVRRAETEKAECQAYQAGVDKWADGDGPGALIAYVRFVPGRPASPLTEAARKRIAEIFDRADFTTFATVDTCNTLDVMREQKMLVPDSAPGFHAACGEAYAIAHQATTALGAYARLFTDYADHEVAAATEAKIAADTRWCAELDQIRADKVLSVRGDLFPGLLATCATAQTTTDPMVETHADEFLKKYPGHPRTGEVLGALARVLNKTARQGGTELSAPPPSRSVGGDKAVILLHNDSDDPLRIALSGPEPRVDTLSACPTCTVLPDAGNRFCRPEAVLQRIVVAPGEYDVSFTRPGNGSSIAGVRDSYFHWSLQPGKEYFACVGTFQVTG
ncbi:MAG TPA: hypothetical protein VFV67_11475 [Actinophytocola sp.]|uniref:hypothetical protein n=1 Tax=Actinophytocola sp. TaxID=1872138 RepID=UPI002DB79ECE|nr:hypothetical protein [Actinophytocola sp.]HEU5471265.1 hypothetical protein [Actinophytocola sp.]